MKVKAAIAWEGATSWSVEEIELDPPKETEVLIRIVACGVCHSDDHLLTGDMTFSLPMIGGHEGAGIVEAVGEHVTVVKPGDHVVLTMPVCGRCPSCASGRANLCDDLEHLSSGAQRDHTYRHHARGQDLGLFAVQGAYAEYTVVGQENVVKIDEDVPLDRAALIGCGVITGWGSAVYIGEIEAGDAVAVVGVGGVGSSAIQGARLAGAKQIFAIDPVIFKREQAKNFGATHSAESVEAAFPLIQDVTRGRMCNEVILTMGVGDGSMLASIMTLVAKAGKVVVTNVHPASEMDVTLSLQELTFLQKQIRGSCFGAGNARADIPKMIDLYRSNLLDLDGMITNTYRLDELNQAYDDLRAGLNIRGVVLMS